MILLETKKGSFIFATDAGYKHGNVGMLDTLVAEDVKMLAEDVEKTTGVYISGALTETRCLYKDSWGCPNGGEKCFIFEATANPDFVQDLGVWTKSFIALAEAVKEHFNQSTVMVDVVDAKCLYLN